MFKRGQTEFDCNDVNVLVAVLINKLKLCYIDKRFLKDCAVGVSLMEIKIDGFNPGAWLFLENPLSNEPLRYFVPDFLASVRVQSFGTADAAPATCGSDHDLFWLADVAHLRTALTDKELGRFSGANNKKAFSLLRKPVFGFSDLAAAHASLLGKREQSTFRTALTWIGGTSETKSHLPPPTSSLNELLGDYFKFLRRNDIPRSVKKALAYLQLVAIHPFDDGNGRISRLVAATYQIDADSDDVDAAALCIAGLGLRRLDLLTADNEIRARTRTLPSFMRFWDDLGKWADSLSLVVKEAASQIQKKFILQIGEHRDSVRLYLFFRSQPTRSVEEFERKLPMSSKSRERCLKLLEDAGLIRYSAVDSLFTAHAIIQQRRWLIEEIAKCPSP